MSASGSFKAVVNEGTCYPISLFVTRVIVLLTGDIWFARLADETDFSEYLGTLSARKHSTQIGSPFTEK